MGLAVPLHQRFVSTLASFLREHRDEIVRVWLSRVEQLPSAHGIAPSNLRDHMPAIGAYLEKEIGDREYLAGNAFSIADVAIGSMFVNVRHAGEMIDAGRWPKLAAYVERLHARPSFKALIDEETPFVTRFRDAA